jgi:thiamine-phosphate pyrophosphorylase
MLVTDRHATLGRDIVDVVAAACGGGLRLVQVRERDLPAVAVRSLVLDLHDAVPAGTVILLNGRPELALELGCGMHLSSAAPLPAEGERPEPWGRAVHDGAEAAAAAAAGASYLTAGTIFPTPAKPGFAGKGIPFLKQVVAAAGRAPVYAIGGVDVEHAGDVRAAGAHGIAVRRAILEAARPEDATRRLLARLAGESD